MVRPGFLRNNSGQAPQVNRVIIVHGWDGHPNEGWYPWLKKELEQRGFEVTVPQLPEPEKPRIQNWIPALSKAVGNPDEQTYLIGHSMGCQTIARYLETLSEEIKVGGAIFVAGFFKRLTGLEDDPEVQETDKHWLTSPLDFNKVRSRLKKSVAIFSDDDPWVPLDNQDDFRDKLDSEIVIVNKMGHFSGDQGITELPIVLEKLLEIAK